MMIFVNEVYKVGKCPREYADNFIKMFSCICPHVGEEIWQLMGHDDTIAFEKWPEYDETKTIDDEIEIAVQVNGKTRTTIKIAKDIDKESAIAAGKEALGDRLQGKNIVKEIYVPGRIINIVAK